MTEDQARKAKIIYDHYGDKVQRRQLVEECSELIQALCKYERTMDTNSGVNIVKVEKDILGEIVVKMQSSFAKEKENKHV